MGFLENISHNLWEWPEMSSCKESGGTNTTPNNRSEHGIIARQCYLLNPIDESQFPISVAFHLKDGAPSFRFPGEKDPTIAELEHGPDGVGMAQKENRERDDGNFEHSDSSEPDDDRDDLRLPCDDEEQLSEEVDSVPDQRRLVQEENTREESESIRAAEEEQVCGLGNLQRRCPQPRKSYDKNGQLFLHVFHVGLSTIVEDQTKGHKTPLAALENNFYYTSTGRRKQNTVLPPLKRGRLQEQERMSRYGSDLDKMLARWEHAKKTMEGPRRGRSSSSVVVGLPSVVDATNSSVVVRPETSSVVVAAGWSFEPPSKCHAITTIPEI